MFKKHVLLDKPVQYPSGVCIKTEKGLFYIKGKKRFKVTPRVASTWKFRVIDSNETMASNYKAVGSLGFRSGSVVRDVCDSKVYFIEDGKRRHIMDPDVLDVLQLSPKDILLVSSAELSIHDEGNTL